MVEETYPKQLMKSLKWQGVVGLYITIIQIDYSLFIKKLCGIA